MLSCPCSPTRNICGLTLCWLTTMFAQHLEEENSPKSQPKAPMMPTNGANYQSAGSPFNVYSEPNVMRALLSRARLNFLRGATRRLPKPSILVSSPISLASVLSISIYMILMRWPTYHFTPCKRNIPLELTRQLLASPRFQNQLWRHHRVTCCQALSARNKLNRNLLLVLGGCNSQQSCAEEHHTTASNGIVLNPWRGEMERPSNG
jgi:hypothetical protein